ncbi:RNA polymerase sigma factor [Aestuariivivens sp. NBU2969]|uniref:RNA polymerase sigma factor n=1 Tax=Aestuariivivens sp. NBU2969 TaxID=2873267 RepID=UPI001CBAA090|nr:RNA polymerase sigma-70 factor [Aestuariivivens sp. NBU2969]
MKGKFTNDKKLINHLKKGNPKAYTFLVDLYYNKLCGYASNLARDDFRSEDIVQNVFVRIWEQREWLNSKTSIKNYLYRSVYNEFIDQYRKEIAISTLEKKYIEVVDTIVEIEGDREDKRILSLIEQEIAQLPAKCKETFILSKKEGLTYLEIAEYQNVSVNTVEKQMVKAFSVLRERLKEKILPFLILFFRKELKL